MTKRTKYTVPDGCGPLVDAIFQALRFDDSHTIRSIKADINTAAAFLDDVPDDTPLEDMDILSEGGFFSPEVVKEIRAAVKYRRQSRKPA